LHLRRPLRSTPFPYTTLFRSPESATLAVSRQKQRERLAESGIPQPRSIVCRSPAEVTEAAEELGYPVVIEVPDRTGERGVGLAGDRKSTRLNSSHLGISYAVF